MTTASTNGHHPNTPQDVEERVLKVIALTKRLPRESVTPASSFESLGIDSLDRLNILFDLESEFDIEINDEDAKRVENIPQMVAGVLALVEANQDATGSPPAAAKDSPDVTAESSASVASHEGAGPARDTATKPASSGE